MARGNAKMAIFLDERDYRQFVFLLGKVVESHSIRCWNYCLMPNHYHLTLQPNQPNFSSAIRHLNGAYGNWWNQRHDRVGHVFQGRFKAQIVDKEEYLVTLSRYVALNPVRAGLVERPEEWSWSSYRATAGLSSAPAFLDTAGTLNLFGSGEKTSQQARFAEAMAPQADDPGSTDRIRSNEQILGPLAFKQRIEASQRKSDPESDPGLTPV